MALVDEAARYFKGKLVVVVTTVESEGYVQEVAGTLLDASGDCLVVQQGDDETPTIINTAHVAWVYAETPDEGEGEE